MTTRTSQNPGAARVKPRSRPRREDSSGEQLARLQATISRLEARVSRLLADRDDLRAELRAARAAGKTLRDTVGGPKNQNRMLPADTPPPLPTAAADGHYPALEFAYAALARTIITRRKAAGWSQAELAAKAGVRTETVNRLEGGRHSPNVRTVDKIDAALKSAGV
jgi:DNA-binding XRE family transcriptional regulator